MITDCDPGQIFDILKKLRSVPVQNLTEALKIHEIDAIYEVLTPKRLYYLQKKYCYHFYFYQKVDDVIEIVYRPIKVTHPKVIHFLLSESWPETLNGIVENFQMINHHSLLPKMYICEKTKGCKYSTEIKQNFQKHEKICGISNVQTFKCEQISYGDDKSIIKEMIFKKLIPIEAINYQNNLLATFDLETIEEKLVSCQPFRGLEVKAKLRLLSIASGSNIPGTKSKCWIRRSMDPSEELRIIHKFVKELDYLYECKKQMLPNWIQIGLDKVQNIIDEMQMRKCKFYLILPWYRYRTHLNKFMVLDTFGFNSGKFDVPTIAAPLFLELKKKFG